MQWSDKRKRQHLPIDNNLETITNLLEKNQVIVCQAGTGAGKSTRIPQALLLQFPEKHILMTQPRRNACRWIGARIAAELGTKPGKRVAWSLRNDTLKYNPRDVQLELLIDQSLVNRICKQRCLPEGIIIVDEAHERSISTDLLLGLIKEHLAHSPNTQVLITSATIDTKKFSDFFDEAPIVSVQGRCFPVSTELVTLMRQEHHTQGTIRAANDVMQRFAHNTLQVSPDNKSEQLIDKGAVVILLPGKEDISLVKRELEQTAKYLNTKKHIEILTCHGDSTSEEQNKIQKPVSDNTLRFICSTEILRSSVTVPDTIGVIDSLQIKRMVTNAKGVGGLEKVLVSKAEAEQAKGRAGRTAPGFYMPVGSFEEYENLAPWPIPAILREPIARVALYIAAVDHTIREFGLIDSPAPDKIEHAITKLQYICALTADEKITEDGKLLLKFPVEPELAIMLIHANMLKVLPEIIIVIAALEEGDFFQLRKKDEKVIVNQSLLTQINKAIDLPKVCVSSHGNGLYQIDCGHRQFSHNDGARWINSLVKQAWSGDSNSDFSVIVHAYRAFKLEQRLFQKKSLPSHKRQQITQKHFRNWCEARGLNYKRMQIIDDKIAEIIEVIHSSPLNLSIPCDQPRKFDDIALIKAIARGKIDHVVHKEDSYWQIRQTFSGKIANECQLDFNSACSDQSDFILVGNTRKIHKPSQGEVQYDLLVTIAASIKTDWLIEIAPNLCQDKLLGNYYYDAKNDCIKQTKIQMFDHEHELSREEVIVTEGITKEYLADFDYDPKNNTLLETEVIFVDEKEVCRRKTTARTKFALAKWLAKPHCSSKNVNITNQDLSAFLQETQQCHRLAQRLNSRAGKTLIECYSVKEMIQHFCDVLGEKQPVYIDDVTLDEWQTLRLPRYDLAMLHRELKNYPDGIRLANKQLDIHYPDEADPYIELETDYCNEAGLFEFVKNPLLLADNRQIRIHVKLEMAGTFVVGWDDQHADLSRCPDLSKINFFKIQSFTTYHPSDDERLQLPYFLRPEDLESTDALQLGLSRLNNTVLIMNQLQFVQWSVAAQVANHCIKINSTELLSILQKNHFITKTDFISNIADGVSSWFGYFSRSAPKENPNIELLDYIKQTKQQIRSCGANTSEPEHVATLS